MCTLDLGQCLLAKDRHVGLDENLNLGVALGLLDWLSGDDGDLVDVGVVDEHVEGRRAHEAGCAKEKDMHGGMWYNGR